LPSNYFFWLKQLLGRGGGMGDEVEDEYGAGADPGGSEVISRELANDGQNLGRSSAVFAPTTDEIANADGSGRPSTLVDMCF
jgi:hypothetical protein